MKTQNKTATTKAIWGVVKRGEQQKGFWTRIGTAYVNRDGSLNLRFDYLPVNLGVATIQVRPIEPTDKAEPALAETLAEELLP